MPKVERACKNCGKLFLTHSSEIKIGKGKYCSRSCSDIGRVTTTTSICSQCGISFEVWPSQIKNGRKYCSPECSHIANTKQVECTCTECGVNFYVTLSQFNRSEPKFCSKACQGENSKIREIRACKECGKRFEVAQWEDSKGGRKYCSKKCADLAKKQLTGDLNHFWKGGWKNYRGPNWLQQRNLARERDQGICQHCHRKPKLRERRFDIHHIIKSRHFGKDYDAMHDLKNLITLCPECHRRAEHSKIILQPKLF